MSFGARASSYAPAGGGWTPASLPNLAGWWDASDTATITHSSGAVSQWNDKSGNSRHFTQGTAANQPTTGTVTVNGLNALDFDGTNDYMDTASATVAQPLTFLIVASIANSTTMGVLTSVGGDLQFWIGASSAVGWYAGGGVLQGSGNHTGFHVYDAVADGASSAIYIDGSSVLTGNPGTSGTTTGFRVGAERGLAADYYLDASMCEIVVCGSALGSSDRGDFRTYAQAKWGTP